MLLSYKIFSWSTGDYVSLFMSCLAVKKRTLTCALLGQEYLDCQLDHQEIETPIQPTLVWDLFDAVLSTRLPLCLCVVRKAYSAALPHLVIHLTLMTAI